MIRFNFINRIPPFLRNKYLLTIIIFIVWLLFLDSNNFISRYKEIKNLNKLRSEHEYYIKKIADDKRKLHELKTDNQNLEKFAREQYRMKRPDEDLYILVTPQEDRKITRKNN